MGAEHIIAEGLGGTLELPLASCLDHEREAGALVEGDVLGRTLKALRAHLKLQKKKRPLPKTLPLDANVKGIGETRLDIPLDDFPIFFSMPVYTEPVATANASGSGKASCGMAIAMLRYDLGPLYRKYKITSCATASWDNLMFCRMLAKIAHAFAVAELGLKGFTPAHLELINDSKASSASMIGCNAGHPAPHSGSNTLHMLELGYQRIAKETFVVARITLFARHGGPTYAVYVGPSLESPMARLRRVFSSRISLMLSR